MRFPGRPAARCRRGPAGGVFRRGTRRDDVGLDSSCISGGDEIEGRESGTVPVVVAADRDGVVTLTEACGKDRAVAVVDADHAHESITVDGEIESPVDFRRVSFCEIRVESSDPAVVLDGVGFRIRRTVAACVEKARTDPAVRIVKADRAVAGNEAGGVAVEIGGDMLGVAADTRSAGQVSECFSGEEGVRGIRLETTRGFGCLNLRKSLVGSCG